MKKFAEVKALVAALEADVDKFYNKSNSAAGTRVRKGMQDLKNLAQSIRLEVQETKNKAYLKTQCEQKSTSDQGAFLV